MRAKYFSRINYLANINSTSSKWNYFYNTYRYDNFCEVDHQKSSTQLPQPFLTLHEHCFSTINRKINGNKIIYDLPSHYDSTFVSDKFKENDTSITTLSQDELASLFPTELISYPPSADQSYSDSSMNSTSNDSFSFLDDTSSKNPCAYDFGKFRMFSREQLINSMPEGLAGELQKDITMIPSPTCDIGIMFRKITYELMQQMVQFKNLLLNNSENINPASFENRILYKKAFSIRKSKRGFLLDGKRGTGKSCVLNYLILWARENGWLVVFEPKPSRYSREVGEIKRSNSGLYIQSEFSREFLERVVSFNKNYLLEIPINKSSYGSCALDGNHRLYNQRIYDELVEKAVNSEIQNKIKSDLFDERLDDVDDLDPDEEKRIESDIEIKKSEIEYQLEKLKLWKSFRDSVKIPSINDQLKDPQNLHELAMFGIENEAFATQAVYEIMEQLKKQKKFPLLLAVDEWNEVFHVSEYLSMKYENTKYNAHIPSYHLTMPRVFYKWDGDQYTNGIKIVATCWRRMNRRDYRPELLGIRQEEIRTVRNFNQHEFSNYVNYSMKNQVIKEFPADKLLYFYMLTGGNGFQSRRLLATLY